MSKNTSPDKRIGILSWKPAHAIESFVALSDLNISAVDTTAIHLPEYHCPYHLPYQKDGDIALICSYWLHRTCANGLDPISDILLPLKRYYSCLIGFDHNDSIHPSFSDDVVSELDAVLKWNGIYRDPDLYKYSVGAPTPNGNWGQKLEPHENPPNSKHIAKLQASIPCFFNVAHPLRIATRRLWRGPGPSRWIRELRDRITHRFPQTRLSCKSPPKYTANFFGSLTHGQRLQAVQLLKRSGLRWKGGITQIYSRITGFRQFGMSHLTPQELATLEQQLRSEGLLTSPLSFMRYRASIQACKAVISITGHGELCFRMGEAWANRRILVCQDLSHIHTLYPLRPGKNVVYCKSDLSDLIDVLEDIECNFSQYIDIAEQGYQDWLTWEQNAYETLNIGFAPLYT